jgi:Spy/CpxP family protein refolding chaperone
MKVKTFRRLLVLALTLALSLSAYPSSAQDKPADNMEILREKIRADKRLFIAQNLQLTESQAQAFWPVYDEYQKGLGSLAKRSGELIEAYAENYQNMSNDAAKKMLQDYLNIQGDRVKLMQSYLPKFRAVLPETKVARYYQLENKIHAAINYELARIIPLIK